MVKYVIVSWPEIQDFMIFDSGRFHKECFLLNSENLPDSSYVIPEKFYNEVYDIKRKI